jgi:hypothetical protein
MRDIHDLPERDPAKVQELANAIRELATGMRAADVVKALASVITSVVCETSRNRRAAHAIIAALNEEMLLAVERSQRPDWPIERQH